MSLSPERLAQIKAATADISVRPSDAGSSTGTIGEFLRSRSESAGQDSSVFNIGGEMLTGLKKRINKATETTYDSNVSIPERVLRVAGETAGAVGDVVGSGLKAAYQGLVPDAAKKEVRRWGREILDTEAGQAGMEALHSGVEAWNNFEKENPNAAADLGSVVNIASLIPIGGGVKIAKGATTATVDALRAAPGAAKKLALNTVEQAGNLYQGAKKGFFGEAAQMAGKETAEVAAKDAAISLKSKIGAGLSDVAAEAEAGLNTAGRDALQANRSAVQRVMGVDQTATIPDAALSIDSATQPMLQKTTDLGQTGEKIGSYLREKAPNISKNIQAGVERRAPNIAAKKAESAAYDSLKPEAQKAVRGGLLRRDVEAFTSGNDKEKSILKDMVKAAEENTNNRGTTHPSDLVGKEMNRRIKLLDEDRKTIGKALGEHVKDLKTKDIGGIETVQNDVLTRLNEVQGLEGIKTTVDDAGKTILDFSDTAMAGPQTEGARNELQAIFDDMSNKTPYQLHRQRQELFESLGGKKAAKLQLTDTQEQGMDAVREGIADSLERISPDYKALNAEYRGIVTPLKEMRKFYKGTEGAAEDVLDAKGGLLARRLTSNVASAPELRRILDDIGSQLTKRGHDVSDVDLNKLQDFYNALSRYYDISKDTSFEGLIKSANANPTEFTTRGIAKKMLDTAFQNSYITKDSQRAAIKELIGN